jgi:TRAP-type C4-dicarboxylate transport system permease small subunit
VSFALVALLPARALARADRLHATLGVRRPRRAVRRALSTAASLAMLAAVILLVVAGFRGSRDPLHNPLPLFV